MGAFLVLLALYALAMMGLGLAGLFIDMLLFKDDSNG